MHLFAIEMISAPSQYQIAQYIAIAIAFAFAFAFAVFYFRGRLEYNAVMKRMVLLYEIRTSAFIRASRGDNENTYFH